ncbi:signal peptidase II [Candidatus Woesearchaeota archaeon]|nr:signal peptidase II [Candidatus Woesearchaeota archaeon]
MVGRQESGLFFFLITAATVLVDQAAKLAIVYLNPVWNLLVFDIHLVTNTGAGFGLFQGKTIILGFISLAVALGIILYYHKIPKTYSAQLLTALFLGGVIGNFIDRFARGHVIDFIDFRFWPAFNVADAAISIAVIGLVWKMWKEREPEHTAKR